MTSRSKGRTKNDAISIVEAAYDLEGDARAWLTQLLERVAPALDRGFGVIASMYTPNIAPSEMPHVMRRVDKGVIDALVAMSVADLENFHRLNSGMRSGTVTGALGLTAAEAQTWAPFVNFLHPLGIRELTGIAAPDPDGSCIGFTVPMPDLRGPSYSEFARWGQITTHIAAGARLRRSGEGATKDGFFRGAEAVLSPSGATLHAEVAAQSAAARDSLRSAAMAIDRARTRARSNDDEALELWRGLVAGRWSLVEQFDSDGRRFLVARHNDPQVSDPRALTLRERQVLAYTAMGHPQKLIAYALGLSVGTVSAKRASGMRKLGLRTQADVARLFAPAAPSGGGH